MRFLQKSVGLGTKFSNVNLAEIWAIFWYNTNSIGVMSKRQ